MTQANAIYSITKQLLNLPGVQARNHKILLGETSRTELPVEKIRVATHFAAVSAFIQVKPHTEDGLAIGRYDVSVLVSGITKLTLVVPADSLITDSQLSEIGLSLEESLNGVLEYATKLQVFIDMLTSFGAKITPPPILNIGDGVKFRTPKGRVFEFGLSAALHLSQDNVAIIDTTRTYLVDANAVSAIQQASNATLAHNVNHFTISDWSLDGVIGVTADGLKTILEANK